MIEEIIAIIEEEGYDWTEYDTDGAMVIELEDENSGQELARKINEELPEGIEIEFENFWKRGYFHKRKHYATLDSAKNEVEFVGGWFFKKDVPEIINPTVRDYQGRHSPISSQRKSNGLCSTLSLR